MGGQESIEVADSSFREETNWMSLPIQQIKETTLLQANETVSQKENEEIMKIRKQMEGMQEQIQQLESLLDQYEVVRQNVFLNEG